jgi:outer membrane protein
LITALLLAAQAATASASVTVAAPVQDSLPVLTLARALEGVGLNPAYVQAAGEVGDAEWSRRAARLAFFLPTVSANLDVTKYSTAFFNIGTGGLVSTNVTARLDARYEVFSARKFTDLARTQAELDAAQATEAQSRFAAALQVEAAFYAVLAGEEFLRVAEERVGRAGEQLVLARARVASGAAVQTDSLQVRLEVSRADVIRLELRSALRVGRLELGRRAGFSGPAAAAPDDWKPHALPITVEQAILQAVEQGPEYRAARARERSAQADLKGNRGGYLPTLTLSGSHVRFDDHVFPSARNVSSLTFSLNLPIWNGGQREIAIARARTNRDVAQAIRSDLERAAARDVTFAYDAYETALARLELDDAALVVARENYRVQSARYQAGATTVLDLLDAQGSLSQAEADRVNSRYTARLALAALEAMLGTRLFNPEAGK